MFAMHSSYSAESRFLAVPANSCTLIDNRLCLCANFTTKVFMLVSLKGLNQYFRTRGNMLLTAWY